MTLHEKIFLRFALACFLVALATTSEISRNVQEASKAIAEVSRNINGVQRAASETGTASARVLEVSRGLAEEAEKLGEQMSAFIGA